MFAKLLLTAINRLLVAEAWAGQLLQAHVGQTALLEIAGLPLRFSVGEDLQLHTAAADSSPTVSLQIPAEALPDLLDGPAALTRHAHISGNAAFAETIARLLQHLRPDLAGHLAPWVGDILATRIARGSHSLGQHALATGRKLGEAGVRFVRDEQQILVSQGELETFSSENAALKARLDALDARLNRLSRKH